MKHKLITLLLSVAVIVGLMIVGCAPEAAPPKEEVKPPPAAPEEEVFKFTLSSCWEPINPLLKCDEYIADKCRELSNGRLDIKVHPAGELVPAFEGFEVASSGAVEMSSTAPAYQAGKNTAFSLCDCWPLYLCQQDMVNWYYQGGGMDLYNELWKSYNLIGFWQVVFDQEAGFRSHVPLTKPEDFAGVKFRIGCPESQELITRWGGSVISLSGGEIYEAMERGVIDAFEYMTPDVDWEMGFQEICEYWCAPAWYQTGVSYASLMNLDAYNSLPDDLKAIYEEVCKACTMEFNTYFNVQSAVATKKFLDYGTKVIKLTDEFWGPAEKEMVDIMEKFAAENPDYARILKSQVDYLKAYTEWKKIQEPFQAGRIAEKFPEVKDEWLK
jgi:TRAP-type mannitol/chloroaromatic compound transport system substrate-binding protein